MHQQRIGEEPEKWEVDCTINERNGQRKGYKAFMFLLNCMRDCHPSQHLEGNSALDDIEVQSSEEAHRRRAGDGFGCRRRTGGREERRGKDANFPRHRERRNSVKMLKTKTGRMVFIPNPTDSVSHTHMDNSGRHPHA